MVRNKRGGQFFLDQFFVNHFFVNHFFRIHFWVIFLNHYFCAMLGVILWTPKTWTAAVLLDWKWSEQFVFSCRKKMTVSTYLKKWSQKKNGSQKMALKKTDHFALISDKTNFGDYRLKSLLQRCARNYKIIVALNFSHLSRVIGREIYFAFASLGRN